MKQSGYYRINLTADNGKGVVLQDVKYIYLLGDKPEPIRNMSEWISIVKNTGEPGETVEVKLAGGEKESYVYCDLIHKNKIVESRWVKVGVTPVSVTYPVKEEYRGGFMLQFSMIQNNRLYTSMQNISVPFTNKMLDVRLATFRDKLLPGENEKWTMTVSDRTGAKAAAEIAATLYDASLDAFATHNWSGLNRFYSQFNNSYSFSWHNASVGNVTTGYSKYNQTIENQKFNIIYADINWKDAEYLMVIGNRRKMMLRSATMAAGDMMVLNESVVEEEEAEADNLIIGDANKGANIAKKSEQQPDLTAVATRTNFNETAFFYPVLRTNSQGEVLIEFTVPEALTQWKLLSLAHTKDLKIGTYTNELITQKQVAISANAPRFFRENDEIEFTAKVNNLTDNALTGQALLRLYDAVTMQPADEIIKTAKIVDFKVETDGSAGVTWRLQIPAGLQALMYKVTAQAGTHSDGEEKTVPVLTNSMLVTETMPFSIRAGQTRNLSFDKLINNKSQTLRNHSLTLEYTSAPAWYAVQALPYVMEYPYECAEQTFARYYANSLATAIVNKTPRIKQIFEQWSASNAGALLSNLEKNQELKQVMLEETPWVLDARNETERKRRIGLLFDLNRMSNELSRTFGKLSNMQNSDGGFPWFDGSPSSRYITQHIVSGLAHLQKLDAVQMGDVTKIIERALTYLDERMWEDYDRLVRSKADLKKQQISSLQLHYLYSCSFSVHKPSDRKAFEAFDYYLALAGQLPKNATTYNKALAALVLHRFGQHDKAMEIIRLLKEYAMQSEELGMYWKDNVAGYFWHEAPIETQALLIETFNEVAADSQSVEEMKIWLLRNKQTNDWRTTKATSEAVYALLMTGGNLLDESRPIEIELGGSAVFQTAQGAAGALQPEPGTGYVKTSWHGGDIKPQMGNLKVYNPNSKGIAWGGMYWQYFEQLDKITSSETSLSMKKQLYLRTLTDRGEQLQPLNSDNSLKIGDLVRVRMELRADRDYEYVHLKDMRASCFEPVSTLSRYRRQDGLGYYESVKDASVNFFITYLPKGVYVFEYDLRVSHAGEFSNGITTFQCMYAPEFSSHSEGVKVSVKR